MKPLTSFLITALAWLTIPIASIAADTAKATAPPFALYPVVPTDTPDSRPFLYTHPTHSKPVTGSFRGPAILTLGDVSAVGRETREIATAPFTGITIALTAAGRQKLREHLKTAKPSEVAVALDGEVYATLDSRDLRYLIEERGSLLVIFADPYSTTTRHLTNLLAEKLSSELGKQPKAK